MREIQSLYSLNRGIISPLGLARMDVKRLALAAETQTNWMPRAIGPMALRPGFGYLGSTYSDHEAKLIRFIFSTDDVALLELTSGLMRVWSQDSLLTRPAVTTTITNGTFATDLSGWTDNDDGGATSSWIGPNYMRLVGTGTARAIRDQTVTCLNLNIEHGIRITIARGPVMLRIGSSLGADDYVSETTLYEGTHSLSIVPTGDFYVRFFSRLKRETLVSGCTIESAGVVTVPTPWLTADLDKVRYDQSADVVFVACAGKQQRRIERRGTRPNARSFSVVKYQTDNGPFEIDNLTPTTLTASAISGNITLTSSVPLFSSGHVGALFSITSTGQTVTKVGTSNGDFTDPIRVVGILTDRTFSIVISGDATGSTVDLQRSYDNSTWSNVGAPYSWTADTTTTNTDGLNNQIVYYRLFLTTVVAPDNVTMTLTIGTGQVRGIVRVTGYTSATSVNAEVITDLGGTNATSTWQEGKWSDVNGWPTSVRLHEGRMWWAGKNGVWGSISDAYDSFDETFLGDAGTINRTIGSGPVDTINWLLSLKGMLLGAQGAEYSARASSLDEPLTPTNFNLKVSSTQGSGEVEALKVDQSGYFVNRAAVKVFDLSFDLRSYDYQSTNLMELAPELGLPGIVRMDCQRLPDTRLHCVRSDGTAIVCVLDKTEEVIAWVQVETDGIIEDVAILPAVSGDLDDQVYYVVRRSINGAIYRFVEKWAQEIDCRGGSVNKQADAFLIYSGPATNVISAPHLAGQQVVVWSNGQDIGTDDSSATWTQRYTLDGSGNATIASHVTSYVVGLGYTATFKSAKLGTATQISPLNQQKKIKHIGLILAYNHPRGVRFGPSLDYLDDMPLVEDGKAIGTSTQDAYDQNVIEFPGVWTTDLRVCLKGVAPRPCNVLAVTLDMERYS